MAPTEEESKKVLAWVAHPGRTAAELSAPERFLAVMAPVPRMRAKCAQMLFRAQFRGLLDDVRSALSSVHAACTAVSTSRLDRSPTLYTRLEGQR